MIRFTPWIALLLIAACGGEAPPQQAAAEEEAKPEHFLSEHHKAMDKARALQDQLNTAAKDRLDEVDRQTRDAGETDED